MGRIKISAPGVALLVVFIVGALCSYTLKGPSELTAVLVTAAVMAVGRFGAFGVRQ